ncbi:hypothetical protein SD81_028955 [Tolypothrix campylonemoides VB511288]|nr:hypothetical protein SD81_028955 [Tolypothrix campylonemoides VB511288]
MTNFRYQLGGSLANEAPSYVIRKADSELFQALNRGEFCYVLNTRQMGKSSIMVRTRHLLQQQGYRCTTVDMSSVGGENITPLQWYKGVVSELWRGFNLLEKVNLKSWWREEEGISLLQLLNRFIEDILLVQFPQDNIVIFIDEIDSILSLDFTVDDFFALIRSCYNRRAINPQYNRLTFAIFGVATPSDLIADKNRTPFNIGTAIELHGFQLEEVQPLIQGLKDTVTNPEAILKEILAWTGGQPFLTQKVCKLCLTCSKKAINSSTTQINILPKTTTSNEKYWIKQLVHKHIIHNWESQDEPQHLRTISDRILRNEKRAGRMLSIYQLLLQGVFVKVDDSREQIELLLSGLVVKQQGVLQVTNRIYQEVFNTKWVEKQFRNLRPYSQAFDAWIASKQTDESRLLRGQALRDAQAWAQGKSMADLDYQFLAASQELDRKEVEQALEAKRLHEVEARLTEERKRLAQEKKTAKLQRFLLLVVSIGLVIAMVLGITAFIQYQHATISEIKAIATSSQALFTSNQRLDALLQAIKATQRLQKLGATDKDTQKQVDLVLRQTVYGAIERNRLLGHSGTILGVTFSPDGNLIASASGDNSFKLWKRDGTELRTFTEHSSIVFAVAFSPDSQTIASASGDKTIKLWTRDGKLLNTLTGHNDYVYAVAFSPNGQMIASSSKDKTVKLWSRDGTLLATLKGHTADVRGIAFSPKGDIVASASWDNTVKLWKIDKTGAAPWAVTVPIAHVCATLKGHTNKVWAVAFSRDGSMIASSSEDNTVKLWKIDATGASVSVPTTLEGHTAVVRGVAFSPDGRMIASASDDNTVKLWKQDGTLITTFNGHTTGLWAVAFSPDSSTIASAGWDNIVKLWQHSNTLLTTLNGHNAGVWGIAFSPDGKRIASGSWDNTVKLWKQDGTLLTTLKGHNDAVWAVAFSPDGHTIASASRDGTVKLWKIDGTTNASDRVPITLQGHSDAVLSVAFSPDSQILASTSRDRTIKLWKIDGRLLTTLKGHTNGVWKAAFSPKGDTIASASDDHTVKLWSRDGALLHTFKGHTNRVWGVAFSPDGQLIASASWDKTIKLWKLDGTELITFKGHSDTVRDVAFSPVPVASPQGFGQIIASASADKTVKLWKPDGTELATLNGHSASVRRVTFSPDGHTLASASDDKTAILWNLDQVVEQELVLSYGCNWIRDYLRTSPEVTEEDKHLCDKYR